jgi:hypothetical protein
MATLEDKSPPKGRPRIDGDIAYQIELLARTQRWTAAQIHRHLKREQKYQGRVPSEKSVQRAVRRWRKRDESGRWQLDDYEDGTARLVMPVVAALARHSGGKVTSVSRDEARWIARVREAAPDMPLWPAFLVAWAYQRRTAEGADTEDLDLLLGFAPWESLEAMHTFWNWVQAYRPNWFEVIRSDRTFASGEKTWGTVTTATAEGMQIAADIALERGFTAEPGGEKFYGVTIQLEGENHETTRSE